MLTMHMHVLANTCKYSCMERSTALKSDTKQIDQNEHLMIMLVIGIAT